MPPSPERTRNRLIDAGVRLFAGHGIDNVSLREISRAAGARNVVALQHHFGDRDSLVRAIIDKYRPRIEARRHERLDACAADPQVWPLAAALVVPLAQCLQDDDGGPDFLRVFADLINRPRPVAAALQGGTDDDSLNRWARMVDPLLPPGAARVHRRFQAVLYTTVELSRNARPESAADAAVVTPATVDVVAAILCAPVSPDTAAALEAHDMRSQRILG